MSIIIIHDSIGSMYFNLLYFHFLLFELPCTELLRSKQTDNFISVSLDTNETEVIFGNRDGLKDDQKYVYRLNAFNSIGNPNPNPKLCIVSCCKSICGYCIIIKISVEELVTDFVAVNDSLIECSNTLCKN